MSDVIRLLVDGRPATVEDLHHPALTNYGHYTALQVRAGRVRGLALHLDRLAEANRSLFGSELDLEQVRSQLRRAVDGLPDAAVRINVYESSTIIAVRPPASPTSAVVALQSVPYQRPVARFKHVGIFGQIYHARQAVRNGFHDALLVGPAGEISEGAASNIAFSDGATVVWPVAPHLAGVTMQVLDVALAEAGMPAVHRAVRLADLPVFPAAFVANSIGIVPVSRIDDLEFPIDEHLMKAVHAAYDAVPWTGI